MIPRYSRPEMTALWTDEAKFQKWLEIEIAACEAWRRLGKIPPSALRKIKKRARFFVDRILELEKKVKHDVIAFVTCVAESVGPDGRYLHMGLTSSDVVDTALSSQLKAAGEILEKDLIALLKVLREKAYEYKETPQIGRSHGIHAEPITFGLKFVVWYAEMRRHLTRLEAAIESVSYGKISGAVGTFANIDPKVEAYVCRKMGLRPAPVSTQILQRDRHAHFFTTLALLASSVEKIATEIRHLQRTEVLEAEEYFSEGQKGSSAMPHKRNPILAENLCGLARVVRANAFTAMENVALWHERDISHSSVERIIAPDSTILLDFMLHRLMGLLSKLIVYPERMKKNLSELKGLVYGQQILLKLIEKGLTREEAYEVVQRNAMRTWRSGKNFKEELLSDKEIQKHFARREIDRLFDLSYHLKQIDTIYRRVFKK